MKRSMYMFLLAAIMTTTAVAFALNSPFPDDQLGGCNSVCRSDSNCTNPKCPFCEPFYRDGGIASALCKSF